MKDITLKITGKQYGEHGFEDSLEFITEGKLDDRNGVLYILYDESEVSGMPGCHTRVRVDGDKVRMNRSGGEQMATELMFEQGKRFETLYDTPVGAIELEVMTNSIVNKLSSEGAGSLMIDYHLSLKGLIEGRNKLSIKIM